MLREGREDDNRANALANSRLNMRPKVKVRCARPSHNAGKAFKIAGFQAFGRRSGRPAALQAPRQHAKTGRSPEPQGRDTEITMPFGLKPILE